MHKTTTYTIDEETAKAIKKITGKISDIDMRGTYGLKDSEISSIHLFYDLVVEE